MGVCAQVVVVVLGVLGFVAGLRGAGVVRLEGYSFADDEGPFLGLGVSYFQALRHAKYEPERLEANLRFLSARGFNYIRVLSMVNWDGLEIAPVSFTNREGHRVEAWPDYWERLRALLDMAHGAGLRVEVTIFADAQYVMPDRADRVRHLDGVLEHVRGLEDRVMHLEVANEAWQNGFWGEEGVRDLREFAAYLAERTELLVAITSNHDVSGDWLEKLYGGSAADLATVHFSRDMRTEEGGWLPVRDCYRVGRVLGLPPVTSNEPVGPGSSVATERDPVRLCAAAVFAYLAGLPGYVFHSGAGVYAREPFEEMPGMDAFGSIRRVLPGDVANWERYDGLEVGSPFTVYCGVEAGRYWTEAAGAEEGCHRYIGMRKGKQFVSLVTGVLSGGVGLEAKREMRVEVIDPVTGECAEARSLGVGERLMVPQGGGAWVVRGE